MSERIEGTVFKVYEKTFSGKANYSIKLDGNPIYYRAKQQRFAGIAEPGNRVAFNATANADGQSANIDGPVTLSAPAAVAASGTPAVAQSYGDRSNSIVYQSSRKDALEFVALALSTGSLSLGKVDKKRLGILEAALDRYTALFFEDVNTLGAVVREAENEGKAQAEPEAENEEE